jgi:type VI protein secretion system component VasK
MAGRPRTHRPQGLQTQSVPETSTSDTTEGSMTEPVGALTRHEAPQEKSLLQRFHEMNRQHREDNFSGYIYFASRLWSNLIEQESPASSYQFACQRRDRGLNYFASTILYAASPGILAIVVTVKTLKWLLRGPRRVWNLIWYGE